MMSDLEERCHYLNRTKLARLYGRFPVQLGALFNYSVPVHIRTHDYRGETECIWRLCGLHIRVGIAGGWGLCKWGPTWMRFRIMGHTTLRYFTASRYHAYTHFAWVSACRLMVREVRQFADLDVSALSKIAEQPQRGTSIPRTTIRDNSTNLINSHQPWSVED